MAGRVATQCDQCGQTDTDPKAHVGAVTKHHDCLSVGERQMVVDSSPTAAAVVEACEGGVRGADLLALIETLSKEG